MEGAIWKHRQLLDSSVFANEKKLKIWVWLLLKASYQKRIVSLKLGKGQTEITLNRGDLIFGRFTAEEHLCIDGSTIYKIIHWMESEGMIKIKSNSHYTIITICNYDSYQDIKDNFDNKVTTNEQPSNNQVTTNEQPSNTYKKDNKDKKEKNIFIAPTLLEVETYFQEKGYSKDSANSMFNYYDCANWKDSKGNSVKSWKQKALSVWFKDENKINISKQEKPKFKSICDQFPEFKNY